MRIVRGIPLVFALALTWSACALPPPATDVSSDSAKLLSLRSASITASTNALSHEVEMLSGALRDRGVEITTSGIPIHLSLAHLNLTARPMRGNYAELEEAHAARLMELAVSESHPSRYLDSITSQAYCLNVSPTGIHIESSDPVGVFYGIQTL